MVPERPVRASLFGSAYQTRASWTSAIHLSPVNGDLHGLAPMIVFSGTSDLLHRDSVALAEKVKQADVRVELHVEPGLPHSYALLPTTEGHHPCAVIARAVRREPE